LLIQLFAFNCYILELVSILNNKKKICSYLYEYYSCNYLRLNIPTLKNFRFIYIINAHFLIIIAEFPSIFSVYYNYTLVFSDLFRSILNLHRHFKYVKKLSNEKFLDIRISLLIIKSRDTSNGKIGHFLASLFADSIPFPYDIHWFRHSILTFYLAK
jgi:hypothetical protein